MEYGDSKIDRHSTHPGVYIVERNTGSCKKKEDVHTYRHI